MVNRISTEGYPQKRTEDALDMVRTERHRQDGLWGDQSGNHPFEWMSILGEEYGELCESVNETFFKNAAHPDRGGFEKIVKEATQVAAVAVAIIEAVQRKLGATPELEGDKHEAD